MAKIDLGAFAARAWQAEADALRTEAKARENADPEHAAVCREYAHNAEANAERPARTDYAQRAAHAVQRGQDAAQRLAALQSLSARIDWQNAREAWTRAAHAWQTVARRA